MTLEISKRKLINQYKEKRKIEKPIKIGVTEKSGIQS